MTLTQKWSKIALLNFTVLAAIGVLLRYKILFPLPLVDHKHLLHGHSHFAFAGWVSLALYIGIIHILQPDESLTKQFKQILCTQLLSSYGMLLTFPFMGYATLSIAFSTLSIFVSWWFGVVAWKALTKNRLLTFEKKWFYTALVFNILSALGTFSLAYLMANKIIHQNWYFGSVYFYLHFQYNGWFLFAIMGLLFSSQKRWFNDLQIINSNRFYVLMTTAAIPSLFLSMMWMRLPAWMHFAANAAAFVQLFAAALFISLILQVRKTVALSPHVKWILLIALCAFSLKIILQALSAIPELNKYAFGIRPVVIGFLHLVLLVFVSFFIISYLLQNNLIIIETKTAKVGLWTFITAALINEFVLMMQGISAIRYTNSVYSNELLLGAAIMMFTGLVLLTVTQKKGRVCSKNGIHENLSSNILP